MLFSSPQSSISGSLEFGGSGSMGVLEVHGMTIDNEDEVTVFSDQVNR